MENVVNTIKTLYGDRCDYTYHDEHFVMYMTVKSCCTSDTNAILYVNNTSIKIKIV